MNAIGDGVATATGLFWKAAWALALGYAISAAIQVFVSRGEAAARLGNGNPRQLSLAAALGFASSSCSFAALSATRTLWTKGAALTNALAFMFASPNLAMEVTALALIFLGWQYAAALFLGAPILIVVMPALVNLTRPRQLIDRARKQAEEAGGLEWIRPRACRTSSRSAPGTGAAGDEWAAPSAPPWSTRS